MKEQKINDYPLLDSIDKPADLRCLDQKLLPQLCHELRHYLIQTVSSCGGHFAAGLGVIELSVALHYVFDTPGDRLVWDVGHQAYPHKILTGRKKTISSIRCLHGLSPFPKRTESEYDCFGVGHSSTSISAAVGMAIAAKHNQEQRQIVAIVGDGGLSAGMAYEAMNHLGELGAAVLIVLNDNDMSISPNVGAMSNYLTRILSSNLYHKMTQGGKKILDPLPSISELAQRTKEHVKGIIIPGTLFEELGIHYYGPIDGHDIKTLVSTLSNLRAQARPRLLHITTRKGKGYPPAERDPVAYHAVSRFNPQQGMAKKKPSQSQAPTYSKVFGDWLCRKAETDAAIVVITPAMREGSGLVEFEQRFPHRYFDVGIAEQHAVTLAAGMACAGLHPIVAIYSTFLQRAYDQLIHDVVLQKLPVMFALDRAGPVGPDGSTHTGIFDIAFMRCLPNMTILAPGDQTMLPPMLDWACNCPGPVAIRYPRGNQPGQLMPTTMPAVDGHAVCLRHGQDSAILAFGAMLAPALKLAERLNASLYDMRFIKPLDTAAIDQASRQHRQLISVEDGVIQGGVGDAISAYLHRSNSKTPLLQLGIDDTFQEHGSREQLLSAAGLDCDGLEKSIRSWLKKL